jgi:prepilin-type processing-associated H-X9-DG protein
MVKYGVTQASQYCPTNVDTQNATQLNGRTTWNFQLDNTAGTTGYAIMGYVWLTARPEGYINQTTNIPVASHSPYSITGNFNTFPYINYFAGPGHFDYQSKLKPTTTYSTSSYYYLRAPISSEIELVMDPIVSGPDPNYPTTPYNFGSYQGGFNLPLPSAHLYGATPDGGNVMFMDGHVDWRPFKQMIKHAFSGQGTGTPTFWW